MTSAAHRRLHKARAEYEAARQPFLDMELSWEEMEQLREAVEIAERDVEVWEAQQ